MKERTMEVNKAGLETINGEIHITPIKVPGGWVHQGEENAVYIPDIAYWIAQFVEATACKKCHGTGVDSYVNHLGSRTTNKCDACGGKGR